MRISTSAIQRCECIIPALFSSQSTLAARGFSASSPNRGIHTLITPPLTTPRPQIRSIFVSDLVLFISLSLVVIFHESQTLIKTSPRITCSWHDHVVARESRHRSASHWTFLRVLTEGSRANNHAKTAVPFLSSPHKELVPLTRSNF